MAADDLSLLVFKKVTELLRKLTDEQLAALANGVGELSFSTPEVTVRTGRARTPSRAASRTKPSPAEAADQLRQFTRRDEAQKYLEEKGFTLAELKSVGTALGNTVTGRRKADVIDGLVNLTAGLKDSYPTLVNSSYR
jgi:hypothetical protein